MNFALLRMWIPGKRDKRWLIAIVPCAAVVCAALAAVSALSLQLHPGAADILLWAFLSLVAAGAVCGCGYAGFRIAALAGLAGVAAGIGTMAYIFAQPIEWRGIVGLVSCMQVAFLFFLVGVNAQMIFHFIQKKRRHS